MRQILTLNFPLLILNLNKYTFKTIKSHTWKGGNLRPGGNSPVLPRNLSLWLLILVSNTINARLFTKHNNKVLLQKQSARSHYLKPIFKIDFMSESTTKSMIKSCWQVPVYTNNNRTSACDGTNSPTDPVYRTSTFSQLEASESN